MRFSASFSLEHFDAHAQEFEERASLTISSHLLILEEEETTTVSETIAN